ncbi:hypothetical protein D3C76_1594200 [compost metagenome]
MIVPPAAPATTTIHGGTFQKTSIRNKIHTSAKSTGVRIEVVQSGSYNAANKIPTTAALIPINAP